MIPTNPVYRHRKLWLLVGYALLAIIIYLSLTGKPIQGPDIPDIDKLFHFLAYFVLTMWFVQLYHVRRQLVMHAVVFIGVGILMEVIQSFDPARYYEVWDMIANSLGVIVAVLLASTPVRYLLLRFESLLP